MLLVLEIHPSRRVDLLTEQVIGFDRPIEARGYIDSFGNACTRIEAPAGLTADIVSAYVSNNPLPVSGLPDVIASVHASLSGLGTLIAPAVEPQTPAVNPKRSVTPDFIICLEDGKKFKSLKRHLSTDFGLTPDAYRAKWNLPHDYPMTAPNYAAQRSQLAKSIGLGRKAEPVPPTKTAPAKRKAKA